MSKTSRFLYPTGSIVQLIRENPQRHCGVVLDEHRSIELIATKHDYVNKMICRLIVIDLRSQESHPVTGKQGPSYKLVENPKSPWDKKKLAARIKELKPKYDGHEYHIVLNNCQHFAWDLSFGERKSPDADRWSWLGGPIGFAYKIKDFGLDGNGGSASLVSSASVGVLRSNLNEYLVEMTESSRG